MIAAYSISGRTLQAFFRLSIKFTANDSALSPANLQALQNSLRGVLYLITDEDSMIGLRTLSWIDQRCREIYPQRSSQPFGGLSIVIAGDFYQLPPVIMKPLYYDGALKDPMDIAAQTLYHNFNQTIELNVIRRQSGHDTEALAFKRALDGLRENCLTVDDWKLLTTRV